MEVIKKIGIAILAIVGVAFAIGALYYIGYLVQYVLWIVFFLLNIIFSGNFLSEWVFAHDTAVHLICSYVILPLLLLGLLFEGGNGSANDDANNAGSADGKKFNYADEVREINQNSFMYVDCSGSYRRWGERFIDHRGNWCEWGSGFYDYDDNYIQWGETYKDSSGAYRRFGDDFVDANGNYIRVPR